MARTTSRGKKDWSDIDLDFIAHPTTGDVVKKTGIDAIKRSIRNLVLTNFYDRPFRGFIGGNVNRLLFENFNMLSENQIRNAIIEVIVNFEPRAQLLNDEERGVRVLADPDNHNLIATISFIEVNSGEFVRFDVILERVRQ